MGWHAAPGLRGGWSVRRHGAKRALSTGLERAVAWKLARTMASRDKVTAFLHRRDGTIDKRAEA